MYKKSPKLNCTDSEYLTNMCRGGSIVSRVAQADYLRCDAASRRSFRRGSVMGGINHQPCGKYLGPSTRMSKAFSLARAHFEHSNVALEDALISEIESGIGNVSALQKAITFIDNSIIELGIAVECSVELEQKMVEYGYKPWPSFALFQTEEKMIALGQDLATAGLLQMDSFKPIALPQLEQGFWATLHLLRDQFVALKEMESDLRDKILPALKVAAAGRLANELEDNGELSFRGSFMRAYAKWNKSHDMFLASAVLSTELWFRSISKGSLLNEAPALLKKIA